MNTAAESPGIRLESFKIACSTCNVRELCLPVGLSGDSLDRLDTLTANRRSEAESFSPAHQIGEYLTENWS
jgi:CRP/FNR family transcriptional regulator